MPSGLIPDASVDFTLPQCDGSPKWFTKPCPGRKCSWCMDCLSPFSLSLSADSSGKVCKGNRKGLSRLVLGRISSSGAVTPPLSHLTLPISFLSGFPTSKQAAFYPHLDSEGLRRRELCSSVIFGSLNLSKRCVGMATRRMRTARRWCFVSLFVGFVCSCNGKSR